MAQFVVEINSNEAGVFLGKFTKGLKFDGNEAYGSTVEECLKDLVFRMEQESLATEDERFKHYLRSKRSTALRLVKSLLETVGNGYFDIKQALNKTGEEKEDLLLKLDFLEQFGFLESDRVKGPGRRWIVVMSEEERNEYLDEQIKQLNKTIQGLSEMKDVRFVNSASVKPNKFKSFSTGVKEFFKKVGSNFKTLK